MRTATVVMSLGLTLLALPVCAQVRRTMPVPPKILDQILADTARYEELPSDRDSLAANLVAHPIEVGAKGIAAVEVDGMNRLCGANNCDKWIFRRTTAGYERILNAGGVQTIEVLKTRTNGYRDIMTAQHGSAWDSGLSLYRFDGREYRLVRCFDRTYRYVDRRGRAHDLKHPRITPIACG